MKEAVLKGNIPSVVEARSIIDWYTNNRHVSWQRALELVRKLSISDFVETCLRSCMPVISAGSIAAVTGVRMNSMACGVQITSMACRVLMDSMD